VKVKCVSPHGGGHHGILRNDMPAVEGDRRPLKLPPNEGGYVDCPSLSAAPIPVGSVIDAPDTVRVPVAAWVDEEGRFREEFEERPFVPDGFHFEAVEPPAAPAAPKPAIVIPAPVAGEGK
jgi:hypothetical protein